MNAASYYYNIDAVPVTLKMYAISSNKKKHFSARSISGFHLIDLQTKIWGEITIIIKHYERVFVSRQVPGMYFRRVSLTPLDLTLIMCPMNLCLPQGEPGVKGHPLYESLIT